MFKKKKMVTSNDSNVIWYNDYVNIVHNATKICWDKEPCKTYADKLDYIRRRVNIGHESVLEHSNIIMILHVDRNYINDFIEISENMKYLNYVIKNDNASVYHILIGGSVRGYKYLINNTANQYNKVLVMIKNELYISSTKEFFIDLIECGVMDDRFINELIPNNMIDTVVDKIDINSLNFCNELNIETNIGLHPTDKKVTIVNIDPLEYIYDKCVKYKFNIKDILKVSTCTVLFEGISRAAATQVCRHRNAQTWESQRYVDQSKAGFTNPCDFVEKYDKDKRYEFTFGEEKITGTANDIGLFERGLYNQFLSHGFNKEDARGYLPGNIQVGKIYMTFTIMNLIKFLELRVDSAAQAEVRSYALAIEDKFKEYMKQKLGDDNIYKYLIHTHMLSEVNYDYSTIDEVLSEGVIVEEDI